MSGPLPFRAACAFDPLEVARPRADGRGLFTDDELRGLKGQAVVTRDISRKTLDRVATADAEVWRLDREGLPVWGTGRGRGWGRRRARGSSWSTTRTDRRG